MEHQQPFPQIAVLRQNSAVEEVITDGQVSKIIHIVVKNSPFIVIIGCAGAIPVNLGEYDVDCILLYDTEDGAHKAVDYVKSKPVEFKSTALDRGQQVQLEMRIKVLTSQHEDMNFRVLIQLIDKTTKMPIQGVAAITNPIKVVSKPEQLKKHKTNTTGPTIKAVPAASLAPQLPVQYPSKQTKATQQKQQQALQLEHILDTQFQYTQQAPPPQTAVAAAAAAVMQPSADIHRGIQTCPIPTKMPKIGMNDDIFGNEVVSSTMQIASTQPPPSAAPVQQQQQQTSHQQHQQGQVPPIVSQVQPPPPPQSSSQQQQQSTSYGMAPLITHDIKPSVGMFNNGNSGVNNTGTNNELVGVGEARTITDIIVETLQRIEQKQQCNTEMLGNINENVSKQVGLYYYWGDFMYADPNTQNSMGMGNQSSMEMNTGTGMGMQQPPQGSSSSSSSSTTSLEPGMQYGIASSQQQQQQQQQMVQPPGPINDFDSAFTNLMDAFGRIPPTERATRVRRILQIASNAQRNHISELIDMLQSEGMNKDLGHDTKPSFDFGPEYFV